MSHPHPVAALVRLLDGFSEWTGRLVSWLTLLMVVATFVVVVMRYVFEEGNIALQESVIYMHSFVFLLGAAYTLKHDGHVRVDILYRPRGEKGKAWINLFGTLFLLLPVCGFLFWVSWEYVATSWTLREGSQEAGGIAYRYILKSALLAMPAMMVLQGIAELLRNLLVITGKGHLPSAEEEHAL
ncbi:TRAP transporter small permease subunit [Marinobacterium weihaiense]|uniref:TRAP transporter small permease protein n=1 Tax=Marinobacterium weihaiense TaxID=2851016 RepID=A0ABS6MAB5_9GAMM|nr:TRAP transporter small permease subunit [Marinobacterium weihaiense]MBV0933226.1 TRAP transporter small permease subunit [Marinobacterium weihaiense]